MKVVILGAGNVAFHLINRFIEKNIQVLQIYNRSLDHAAKIADKHKLPYTSNVNEIHTSADVYLLCVSDDGIEEVAKSVSLALKEKLVVHTSGAFNSAKLTPFFKNHGCFYPLQTFTKDIVPEFDTIPILISANTVVKCQILNTLANKISTKIIEVNDEERLQYHLAAVICNNFTNHLFAKAYNLLQCNHHDFNVLMPLIEEGIRKLKAGDPANIQTGPAKRGDIHTIESHLNLLTENPSLKKIYIDISNSINPDLNLTL
jgi:predicted short-subunit dehydrogenase-like oxidoreductase (DUF2520 family)